MQRSLLKAVPCLITYSSDCGNKNQIPKLSITKKVPVNVTITGAKDNRLREASSEAVFHDTPFIDVGGLGTGRYRGLISFNLSEYTGADIDRATLSLFWYYPEGSTRSEDTVIEVYRPASSWNESYVSWNKRDKGIAWNNAGGAG